ncbi:hypothetical protein JVT61DRAFT_10745 [Boletus reticuloceps]|uniref:Uncharacterized protein n=1 Tax=Boletus reticuloceps TaxID=495285 RepID=A0A8I2YFR8_9AGAM|nr:hypothetical protein JVT61DRAFT_10745 [Boletus reticuloceps]
MLREDMLSDIRKGVHAALQNQIHPGLRVQGVTMVGIYTGMDNRKARWAIKLRCGNDFWEFKDMKDEERRLHFLKRDSRGLKILRHQPLVCLASGQNIVGFGTVNRVEELLACNPPLIVLQLDGDVNIRKTLTSFRLARDVQLIQIDTATFAFEPVLSALEGRTVPLAKEILFWSPDSQLEPCRSRMALSHITNVLSSNPSIKLDRVSGAYKSSATTIDDVTIAQKSATTVRPGYVDQSTTPRRTATVDSLEERINPDSIRARTAYTSR